MVNPVPRGLCRLELEPEPEKATQGSWSTAGCPGQATPLWAAAFPSAKGLSGPCHPALCHQARATRPAAITPASEKSRGAMGTVEWPPSTHTPGQGTHLAAPLHSHATTQWPQDKFASLHLRAAVLSSPECQAQGRKKSCVCASSPSPLINTGRLCKLSLGGHAPSCFRTPLPTGRSRDTEQM